MDEANDPLLDVVDCSVCSGRAEWRKMKPVPNCQKGCRSRISPMAESCLVVSVTNRCCWRGKERRLRGRRPLYALSWAPRRGAPGRWRGPLPLASRLLRLAHRGNAWRPGLQPIGHMGGGAARRKTFRPGEGHSAERETTRRIRRAESNRDRRRRRGRVRRRGDAATTAIRGRTRHAQQRRCAAGRQT